MAEIRKFRAYRPTAAMASKIAALPYDVYNRTEAEQVTAANPDSFLAIDRAETAFGHQVDTYDDRVYQKANELLQEKIRKGDFRQDEQAMYYLYALTMNGRRQHGFVACASIDDYENGVIKKHENTRADKELDRIHHVDACSMQTGPIFLAYRQTDVLQHIIEKVTAGEPEVDYTAQDGIGHTVWCIRDAALCEAIHAAFAAMQSIYIADGHHRCASAVKVGQMRRAEHPDYTGEEEFNYFLSVLFPENELMIMDYNRVLKVDGSMTVPQLLTRLQDDFVMTTAADGGQRSCPDGDQARAMKPQKKGSFAMYVQDTWYHLEAKPSCFSKDPVANLDVSILQDRVLAPLFGIEDPKTDQRIDFVGGIRGLGELERRCHTDCKIAFALYPTSIQELFAVADAGRLMPPKSTWFEPKLRSGLFLHEIER